MKQFAVHKQLWAYTADRLLRYHFRSFVILAALYTVCECMVKRHMLYFGVFKLIFLYCLSERTDEIKRHLFQRSLVLQW